MFKFRYMPAIIPKLIMEYCECYRFTLPERFQHILQVKDDTCINYNIALDLISTIEDNSDNELFFFDLIPFIETRFNAYLSTLIKSDVSSAELLSSVLMK